MFRFVSKQSKTSNAVEMCIFSRYGVHAQFFVVLFRVFGIRSLHCFSQFALLFAVCIAFRILLSAWTIRVSVYIGILLQFKVTRPHLYKQMSFGSRYVLIHFEVNKRRIYPAQTITTE